MEQLLSDQTARMEDGSVRRRDSDANIQLKLAQFRSKHKLDKTAS